MNWEKLFNPRGVAVIGASGDKTKVGYALVANLLAGDTARQIFPVSLGAKEILGLPVVSSVKAIALPIDLAIIAVRADLVPQVIAECGEKGVELAIVISAGFKEAGPGGRVLEEKLLAAAREHGVRLLGPNCLGVVNSAAGLNASFAYGKPLPGNIAFVSQSGALGAALFDLALGQGVGFSKFISLGNKADLSELEMLEYLAKDPETEAILLYLESLADGPAFLQLASRITKEKPLVILRAGRSAGGSAAVQSHTGSLAPADAVFSAACRQAGIIEADSIRQFFNLAKLFQLGIRSPLRNLAILTNGGGPSAVAADLVDLSTSLSLATLSEETKSRLKEVLPPMAAVGNPVDVIGDALSSRYAEALKVLAADPGVDGIILMLTPQMMTEPEATAKLITEYRNFKPVISVFLGGPAISPALEFFKQNGLPNFNFPKDAIEALDALARNDKKKENKKEAAAAGAGLKMMSFAEMKKLFADYEILLEGVFVTEKNYLPLAVKASGGLPMAIKAISGDVVHKSESGAVKLNLVDLKAAEEAWRDIKAKHWAAEIEGMLVQPMRKGKEVIIGMKRDPVFGPTILFGLGGIFTEALKDTSLRVAPVEVGEARKMIEEIKGYKILTGLRGEKPVNLDALADLIVKLSRLAVEHPEIKEIDLNPVMATPEGVAIVDARLMC